MKCTLTLELYGEKHTITADENETILDAALRNNLDAPYACMSGTCNSCQAKIISGSVDMENADALSDDEIADGEILTCCAKPSTGALHIKYPE